MNFNKHSNLAGEHAFLGPSRHYWIKYDEDKIVENYHNHLAAQKGVLLHDFAARCIRLGQKLPKSNKTLNMYVNDAIGYKMAAEQVLYFSDNCFGTTDAICFRNGLLRIHDLKSGVTPGRMEQLLIYAAIFCLEYRVKPNEIETELRIYQMDEVLYHKPEGDEVSSIMDKIITFDKIINRIKDDGV